MDVSNASKKAVPAANNAPKPTIIPPLEEFGENPHSFLRPTTAPVSNGFQQRPPQMQSPPLTSQAGPSTHQSYSTQGPLTFSSQSSAQRHEPLSASSTQSSLSSPAGPSSISTSHVLPSNEIPTQSPGAGPSSLSHNTLTGSPANEPPLGGRFVDGTRSMFVKPTQPPPHAPIHTSASFSSITGPQHHSRGSSPLHSDPLSRPAPDPLDNTPGRAMNGQARPGSGADPLGFHKQNQMSNSMRAQPTRPRLDAREAASKLANMF